SEGARARPYDGRPMASLSRNDVAHVARLARLQLTDEQIDTFTPQLAAILEHAADGAALAPADAPPTRHPAPRAGVLRPAELRGARRAPVPADQRPAARRAPRRRHPRRGARPGPSGRGRHVPGAARAGGGPVTGRPTAVGIAAAVRSGERSARSVVEEHLAAI